MHICIHTSLHFIFINNITVDGYLLPGPLEKKVYPYSPTKQMLVQHRQNTSWEPATVMSQSNSNSYWIMLENGTDQPRVYRTRTMLRIRCTDVRQTRHSNSQSTELENAKFHSLLMKLETMSSTILLKIYHRTLST